MSVLRRVTHLFVMIAMVTALASPACEFIAGKGGLMALCGADGSVKTAEIPEELKPYLLSQSEDQSTEKEHTAKSDCPFCLSFSSQKLQKPGAVLILAQTPGAAHLAISPGTIIFKDQARTPHAPRGPPASTFS